MLSDNGVSVSTWEVLLAELGAVVGHGVSSVHNRVLLGHGKRIQMRERGKARQGCYGNQRKNIAGHVHLVVVQGDENRELFVKFWVIGCLPKKCF